MGKVLRSILAVIAGFAARGVMMLVETLNGRVLYPELGMLAEAMTDREAIGELLAKALTEENALSRSPQTLRV